MNVKDKIILVTGGANGIGKALCQRFVAEECADAVIKGLEAEKFLILPQTKVADYIVNKAQNYDRWLHSLQNFRNAVLAR